MIISTNTTWHSGDVIELSGLVQVAHGVTLTIEAGATVTGGTIQVFGNLVAQGEPENRIMFNQVNFQFGASYATPGRMDIAFSQFDGGTFLDATGNASYGVFDVADSFFNGTQGFYIWYPTSDSSFSRNVFNGSQGLSVGTDSNAQLSVVGNAFYNTTHPFNGSTHAAIVNWAAYGDPVLVRHNTFSLPNGGAAIELPVGYSSTSVMAEENFFGTTYENIISDMIIDQSDDLNRASLVSFANFLTTPHPDTPEVPLDLRGGADADHLLGSGYGDTINGGAGADTMVGGIGDDIYVVDNVGDRISEVLDQGSDTVLSSITHHLQEDVENLTLIGLSTINGVGNAQANRIDGNIAANVLNGGAGTDTMSGSLGDDVYIVNRVADRVLEFDGGGNDTVRTSVSLTLADAVENLSLIGLSAINGIGNAQDNRIVGNSATNVLNGGGGADTLSGGLGNDIYVIDNAGDRIGDPSNGGVDLVRSSVTFSLPFTVENLTLTGFDAINGTGNSQRNLIAGNVAANVINGGTGADTLTGRGSGDVFVFAGDFGSDVITDFRTGSDVIDLGGRGLVFEDLTIRTNGDDTIIVVGANRILLEDFSANTLRAWMFDLI